MVEKGARKKYITGMEEAPENVKEMLHSAHAKGMNEFCTTVCIFFAFLYGTLMKVTGATKPSQ